MSPAGQVAALIAAALNTAGVGGADYSPIPVNECDSRATVRWDRGEMEWRAEDRAHADWERAEYARRMEGRRR